MAEVPFGTANTPICRVSRTCTAANEKPDERYRLAERSAAVVAQIQHQTFNVFAVERGNLFRYVEGGASIAGLIGSLVHCAVEGWQPHHAEFAFMLPVNRDTGDMPGGGLFLQFDLVTDQVNQFGAGSAGIGGGDYVQHDLGSLLAADFPHSFVER